MNLYLIRHGQPISLSLPEDAVLPDDEDNGLTDQGIREARALGAFLVPRCSSTVLFSSPIRRALQTADIIDEYVSAGVRIAPSLCERAFGLKAGATVALSRARQERNYLKPLQETGGESVRQHRERVARWFEDNIEDLHADDAVIVSHAGTIEQIQMLIQGSPVENVARFFTRLDTGHYHHWVRLSAHDGRTVWRLDGVNLDPARA